MNHARVCLGLIASCLCFASTGTSAAQSAPSNTRPIEPARDWTVVGVSRDGASALLQQGIRGSHISNSYRWLSIATGAELRSWTVRDLTSLESAGPDTGMISARERDSWRPSATLPASLAALRADWLQLRDPTHPRFASSARGIVFNASHALFVSGPRGEGVRPLSTSAAYEPRISPDGSTVAFAQHIGRLNGHGNYTLHVAPLPAGRPVVRIDDAPDVSYESVTFSSDGARVFFTGYDVERAQYCFRVTSVASRRTTSVLCGAEQSYGVRVVYSPSRTTALVGVWSSAPGQEPGVVDLHWVRLSDGVTTLRLRRPGAWVMGGVTDTGFVVGAVGMGVVLLDPARRVSAYTERLRFIGNFLGVAWRADGEIVLNTAAGLRTVDLRALVAAPGSDVRAW